MSDKQWKFLQDVSKLIEYAKENGYKLTGGELYRTSSQQKLYFYGFDVALDGNSLSLVPSKKRSKTLQSKHMERLAIDFNVFIDGKLTYDANDIRPLGEYWKSLDKANGWGGDWGWDAGHFQRGTK